MSLKILTGSSVRRVYRRKKAVWGRAGPPPYRAGRQGSKTES